VDIAGSHADLVVPGS
jgi:hypothetical protein